MLSICFVRKRKQRDWQSVKHAEGHAHSWPESPGHGQGLSVETCNNGESSIHAGCVVSHLGLPPLLCLWFTGCVRVRRFTSLSSSPGKPCVAVAVQGAEPPPVHCGSFILYPDSEQLCPCHTLNKNQSRYFLGHCYQVFCFNCTIGLFYLDFLFLSVLVGCTV